MPAWDQGFLIRHPSGSGRYQSAITSPNVVELSRRRFCAGCTMNIAWRATR